MFTTVIVAALALLQEVGPIITAGTSIAKAITMAEALVPALIQEAQDLIPTFKNWIAMMRAKDGITPDQLSQLDAIETQIDANYDAALAAAKAEDAAASGSQV